MEQKFDLIVIGTGTGGAVAASKCRKAGWEVAIIDSRPFGGTCALRGCDPKKVLVGAAEMIDGITRMQGKGITAGSTLNWEELMAFKRTFTEPVPESREKNFRKDGIHMFHGRASFKGEDKIQINDEILTSKFIVIANGAKPAELPFKGAEYLTLSDEFLELDQLPAKIIFVGGGFISFEFAHIAARAGSEVHIIHRGELPLKQFDPEQVRLLVKKSEEIGIQVHLNVEVQSISKKDSMFVVTGNEKKEDRKWEADLVVHGAGRIPDLEDMNLEQGNVEYEKSGVTVNEYLQSVSNPRVYSAGDAAATAGLPLTPVAGMESHIVSANILNGNHKKPDYKVMPSVVFTIPKLASVGLSEVQAQEKGYQIRVNNVDTSEWYSYKRTNQKYTMAKIISDEKSGKILGAHLISEEADELINHFATAIQFDLTGSDLKKMIYAYPTAASDLGYMV